MNKIEPIDYADGTPKPYGVRVNGGLLVDKRGRARKFMDSFSAALAGAKEIDRLRAASSGDVKP